MTIGQTIKEKRTLKSLTQEALAEKLGVTGQAVSKWERDEAYPDITLLKPLAKELGISVGVLLGEEPETKLVSTDSVDMDKMLLRVVVDSKDGDKVRVNLPVAIIKIVMENETLMDSLTKGNGNVLKQIDLQQVFTLISLGVMGKLVEVVSADGDNVSIWVE